MRQPAAVERAYSKRSLEDCTSQHDGRMQEVGAIAPGFSAPGGEIPQALLGSPLRAAKMPLIWQLLAAFRMASFLPPRRSEHPVFRASVLSIVLALAVVPNAALVCRTWCDQKAAAASRCHHEAPTTSLSVAGDDLCDDVLNSAVFVREDVRRGVSSPDADHAIPVPRYQLAHSTTDASPRLAPGHQGSLDTRPLSTALRI